MTRDMSLRNVCYPPALIAMSFDEICLDFDGNIAGDVIQWMKFELTLMKKRFDEN